MAKLNSEMEGAGFDELIGGHTIRLSTKNVELAAASADLKRGTILGVVTKADDADKGRYKIVDATKTDGTEIADCVLARDVSADQTPVIAEAYRSGEFNRQKLLTADGDSAAAHEEELRTKNILMTSLY